MATISLSSLSGRLPSEGDKVHMWVWETIGNADQGAAVEIPGSADRSVQFIGTFGGATAILQGSNDGTTWATLTDPTGAAISFTAAGLAAVSELTRYVRPSTSGGTGTDIDCYLITKGRIAGGA